MNRKSGQKMTKEHICIAKYIFKGLSPAQIANKMSCSISSVFYKTNALYAKYNVKNRFEFVISVFSEILDKNKQTIDSKNKELAKLEIELEKIKKITCNLLKYKDHKEHYSYWEAEAKKQL